MIQNYSKKTVSSCSHPVVGTTNCNQLRKSLKMPVKHTTPLTSLTGYWINKHRIVDTKMYSWLQSRLSILQLNQFVTQSHNQSIRRQNTFVPQLTASSSFPLSRAVFDDSRSCRPSAEEHAACCKRPRNREHNNVSTILGR